jgi:hypothetical protein
MPLKAPYSCGNEGHNNHRSQAGKKNEAMAISRSAPTIHITSIFSETSLFGPFPYPSSSPHMRTLIEF